jgi:HEAT repeat protein
MRSRAALCSFVIVMIMTTTASAQTPRRYRGEKSDATGPSTSTSLTDHFGFPVAKRLIESADPNARLRGIARAAAVGTPEAIDRLRALGENAANGHGDPREAIEIVRALAPYSDQASTRKVLAAFVNASASIGGFPMLGHGMLSDDGDSSARFDLARRTAARILAQSGETNDLIRGLQYGTSSGEAAREALLSVPLPASFALPNTAFSRVPAIELMSALGDARATAALRISAHSTESAVRAAAVEALAELMDDSSIAIARDALADKSPRVRVAGAHALAIYGAPERFKAVQALIDDDVTVEAGITLAEETQNAEVTKALAQRVATSTSIELRRAAIAALGRADSNDALKVLAAFVKDADVGSDAARAIAASPNAGAIVVIEKMIADKSVSRLGVRAYVVRLAIAGESSNLATDAIDALAQSRDGNERALGIFAQLMAGRGDLETALEDKDARVRRAATVATLDARYENKRKILLDRLPREHDEGVRALAAIGLLDPNARARVPTLALVDRATAGGVDSALATLARAARKTESADEGVSSALTTNDSTIRAHAAIGLGQSAAPDATGMLAAAYAYEPDASVRRAIVLAIAGASPADSVSRLRTLRLAANLDPDRPTRMIASRALRSLPPILPASTQVAWIHLDVVAGEKIPTAMLGAVLRSDGLAVPIAFDDDGFALVPGMPLGSARLVLAPRLPSDKDAGR